jgi:hypothetical protein
MSTAINKYRRQKMESVKALDMCLGCGKKIKKLEMSISNAPLAGYGITKTALAYPMSF